MSFSNEIIKEITFNTQFLILICNTILSTCRVGKVLYHPYVKLKNTFLFLNNYFSMLQNLLQCFTHYKGCCKISKYLYLFIYSAIRECF